MKHFYNLVKKEFLHIIRDVRTLIILFGIPVTQILIFGYVITNEVSDVKIAILDKSRDSETTKLINKLNDSEYFRVTQHLTSDSEIEPCLRKGEVKQVVVIEKNFARNMHKGNSSKINLILNSTDINTAKMISNYTNQIIDSYKREIVKSPNELPKVDASIRMVFNEKLESSYMFVPGTMALILMLISAMMTSVSIAREKETGTMEVLLASPLNPLQIIIGKVLPYIALSFVNAISIVGLGHWIFGLPIAGSITLLMLESIVFITVSLSLGIMISTLVKTQQLAMFASIFGLMLPTVILSGFIFPIEGMPVILQYISNIVPAKWFIIIVKNIMIKGLGFSFVLKETLIQFGLIIFFLGFSTIKFKHRLE